MSTFRLGFVTVPRRKLPTTFTAAGFKKQNFPFTGAGESWRGNLNFLGSHDKSHTCKHKHWSKVVATLKIPQNLTHKKPLLPLPPPRMKPQKRCSKNDRSISIKKSLFYLLFAPPVTSLPHSHDYHCCHLHHVPSHQALPSAVYSACVEIPLVTCSSSSVELQTAVLWPGWQISWHTKN